MSTNSTIKFYSYGKFLLNLCNHYDGYYSGVGATIVQYCTDNHCIDLIDFAVAINEQFESSIVDESIKSEFNYVIYNTSKGLKFDVSIEKYDKKVKGLIYVDELKGANFSKFRKFIKEKTKEEVKS